MKKLILVFSLLSLGYIQAMDTPMAGPVQEEEKQATVRITVKGEDIAIPFDEFGSAISGSLGTLSQEDQTTLGSGLSEFLGTTVIVNKKDLVVKAQEHLQEKAKKKKELQDKTLAFVHGWMASQKKSQTQRLQLLHSIKKQIEKETAEIIEEHMEKLEQED